VKDGLIKVKNVSKTFYSDWGSVQALQEISFSCGSGEFVSIVGASGCGKTTLLRIIAGLEVPTSGEVFFAENKIRGPGRESAIVFQEPRLFPWQTVEQNIAFGIRGSKQKIKRLIEESLELVGLTAFRKAYPYELSGGMAQRVAIARALAFEPKALLLDEPFSALDAQTRAKMQLELLEVWQRTAKTIILVTHDIREALLLSGKVMIMSPLPGSVKEILTIPFSYPRDQDNPEFIELRKYIEKNI